MAQRFEFRLRVTGPETSHRMVIGQGRTSIGRQAGNDLRLNHPQVSRRHAQFDCTAVECQITDLDSANGTTVNGEKLTPNVPVVLAHNAVIKAGPFELSFEQIAVEAPKEEERPPAQERGAEVEKEPAAEAVERAAAIPPPPLPPPPPPTEPAPAERSPVPPGLSMDSRRLLNYLPGIYHTEFMAAFMRIFESISTPIEWNVDNFDLYLNAHTAPTGFLPWLANWFEVAFDPTWSEVQRRTLLAEAHQIYARRGTRWALSRVLQIYTGHIPAITDLGEDREPFTFSVKLPLRKRDVNQDLIEAIIDANKPAHTTYELEFKR